MKLVYFQGGLGNQLFQYAFMEYLKKHFPQEKICYTTRSYLRGHTHGFLMLRNIGFKSHNLYNKFNYSIVRDGENLFAENTKLNTLYIGYWQDVKFLEGLYASDILKKIVNYGRVLESPYSSLIQNTKNSVSVHVRRGDYLGKSLYSGICTPQYYEKAVAIVRKKIEHPHFFVFSDDIEWCKANLQFKEVECTFVESPSYGNLSSIDMILMSKCSHNIIANSSYSWWASYLNENPEKLIISPREWVAQPCEAFPDRRTNLNKLPHIVCC